MGGILGGGSKARQAQEKALREQRMANERNLAELRAKEQRDSGTRRNPRGRRLFSSDDKTTIA